MMSIYLKPITAILLVMIVPRLRLLETRVHGYLENIWTPYGTLKQGKYKHNKANIKQVVILSSDIKIYINTYWETEIKQRKN